MRRMAAVTNMGILTREFEENQVEEYGDNSIAGKDIPKYVLIYEVNGPFFFGAASKFKEAARIIEDRVKVFIMRLRNVPAIDSTGITTIEDFYEDCQKNKITLVLSGIHAQPLFAAEKAGLLEKIGIDNCCGNIDDALNRAREILGLEKQEVKAARESSIER